MIRIVRLSTILVLGCSALLAASEDPHWAYEGEEGPENWGKLSSEFDTCGKGANQSPIDLVADVAADLPQLDFDYTNPGVKEVNTGHAIQEKVNPGNFVTFMDMLPSFRKQRGEDPYGDPIDYNTLITDRGDYFLYNGSLTTPPCTEGVQWVMIKQPIIASPEQIQHYHDLLGFDNNRPIQPHNSRLVLN